MVQIATMFIVLTSEFNILEKLLPLPTAAEHISELRGNVVESEVNMDLQNTQTMLHNKLLSFSATCAALQEQWKSPSPVLLPAVRESSAWKFLEGTCQLDVQCLRILQLHAAN